MKVEHRMKAAIITRHNIINYGSLLQTIALEKIIEEYGLEVIIIDYFRKDEEYFRLGKTLLGHSNWNSNSIRKIIFLFAKTIECLISGIHFRKEQRKFLNLTRKYHSNEELRRKCPKSDLYITGSDQVWGKIGGVQCDPAFFLDFVPDNKYKISYAASMGRTDFSNEDLRNYKSMLDRYKYISVREDSAKKILIDLGISNVEQVLDPTLIFNRYEWDDILSLEEKHSLIDKKEYILVYQRHPKKSINDYAKKMSKIKGVPVFQISANLNELFRNGQFVYLPDLRDFIECLKKCSLLITDSFHGTAFAINYNVNFVDLLPEGTSTRNVSLLKMLHLEDRIITDLDNYDIYDEKINYEQVNKILDGERIKSKKFLDKSINEFIRSRQ